MNKAFQVATKVIWAILCNTAFILNRFGRSMSDCNESQLGKMTSSGDSVDGFIPNGRSSPLQDNHFPSTSLINGESEEG